MEPQNIAPTSTTPVLPINNVPVSNTSGQGALSVVPEEIKGWSWGAFGFSWIWGIFNGTYIALLALIPYVNIAMIIILGIKGKEWAWRNKKWDSTEHFKRVQRIWGKVWVILFSILCGIALLGMVTAILLASINSARQKAILAKQAQQSSVNNAATNTLPVTSAATSTVWTDPKGRYQIGIPGTWHLTSLNQGEDVAAISADNAVIFFAIAGPAPKGETNDILKTVYTSMGYKVTSGVLGGEDAIAGNRDVGNIKGLVIVGVHNGNSYQLTFGQDSTKSVSNSDTADINNILNSFKYLK